MKIIYLIIIHFILAYSVISFASNKVLSVGYNCIDYIMETSTDFNESDEKEASSFNLLPGGQAATVAYTLKGLGMNSFYLGKFGNDHNAKFMKKSLTDYGVNIGFSKTETSPNQVAFIDVDTKTGEKKIIGYKHPALNLDNLELDQSILKNFNYIFTDGHELVYTYKLVTIAKLLAIPIIADIEYVSTETKKLIKYIDYLIVPEKVAINLTNTKDLKRAILLLKRSGPKVVVITLGKNGCLGINTEENVFFSKPYQNVNVVDSTGAGDNFHAAFIYGLYNKLGFKDILDFANYLGAASCEFKGARIPFKKLNSIFHEWKLKQHK